MRQTVRQKGFAEISRKCVIKYICIICAVLAAGTPAAGCTVRIDKTNKTGNPEFTVLDKDMIPEEMAQMIDERKEQPFRLTYSDEGILYLAEGYGRQPTTGYSVEVLDLYETTNAVCFVTNLMGPEKGEEIKETETFPYVAVKLEDNGKDVVFE